MNLDLLHNLVKIPGASGNEAGIGKFIIDYVEANASKWKARPMIHAGEGFQDCIVLEFGKPRLAAFAHMDSTGFMVRYQNQLIPVGSPEVGEEETLVGRDAMGEIECRALLGEDSCMYYDFGRAVSTGTYLTYKPDFKIDEAFITSPYLDNRAGVFNLLKIAESLKDGLLVFSCQEENGGGTVPMLCRFIYENFQITKALVSDLTWVTDGVHHGDGVVISIRDQHIPRRSFVNFIQHEAQKSGVKWQVEVESSGSSDGREINSSPYPIDWCFIGAPQTAPHSSSEKLYIDDLESMINFYRHLFKAL